MSETEPQAAPPDGQAGGLPLPPPFVEAYDCFVSHYIHLQLEHPGCRPTLGDLTRNSRLGRDRCKRYRLGYEAMLRREMRRTGTTTVCYLAIAGGGAPG